jgi:hypothetical protein
MIQEPKEPLIKRLNKELELLSCFYSKKLGMNLNYKHSDDFSDNDGNVLWAVEFDSITIIANNSLDEFEVGYESFIPGSYWEPESGDYVEYSKNTNIKDAFFSVVRLYLEWEYENFLESQWAEECIAEDLELEN